MLNFRKVLNFKLISLIISIQFLFNTTLYSYPISDDSLRIPAGQTETYRRLRIASNNSKSSMTRRKFAAVLGIGGIVDGGTPQINNRDRLLNLLEELRYSPTEFQNLFRKINNFFSEIELVQQRLGLSGEKAGPDNIVFLENLIQTIRELVSSDPKQSKELFKLLINSLIDYDIFNIIDQTDAPEKTKEGLKRKLVSCGPITQLVYILLKSKGVRDVRCATTHRHTLIVIPKDDKNLLFIDPAMGVIGKINIEEYYKKEGAYWVLKPEYRRNLSQRFGKVLNDPARKILDSNRLREEERKELLTELYFYIHIPQPGYLYGLDHDIYVNSGAILADIGKPEEAVALYIKAIELNPNFAEAYYNLGNAYHKLGKPEQAKVAYLKAIELNPNFVEAYNNLGVVYVKLNKYDEAVSAYLEAIELNPKFTEAYNNLGNIYVKLNKLDEAVSAYLKAIELNPDYAEAYYNLGVLYFKLGNRNEAIKNWREVLRLKRQDLLELLPPPLKKEVREAVSSLGSSIVVPPLVSHLINATAI